MGTQADEAQWSLTEKEKQTLRLMVRGHDAKSIARSLDLSVHTINERLRDARRKMAVSSSREAARLLLEAEGDGTAPHSLGDTRIGEDDRAAAAETGDASPGGAGPASRRPFLIIGAILMTMILGLLALSGALPLAAPSEAPAATQAAPDRAVVAAAEQFLTLVDQGRWDDSYRATGAAFRKLNSAKVWADVSEKVRTPLGAMLSRSFASQQDLPAPPAGYQVVKFQTRFANKAEAVETVSLEREGGAWRVVGVTIE